MMILERTFARRYALDAFVLGVQVICSRLVPMFAGDAGCRCSFGREPRRPELTAEGLLKRTLQLEALGDADGLYAMRCLLLDD